MDTLEMILILSAVIAVVRLGVRHLMNHVDRAMKEQR